MGPRIDETSNAPSNIEDASKSPHLNISQEKDDQSAEVVAKTAQDRGSPGRLDETNESAVYLVNRAPQNAGDDASQETGAKLEKLTNAVGNDQIIKRHDLNSISNSIPETNQNAGQSSVDGAGGKQVPRDLQGQPVSQSPTIQS